MAQHVKKLHPLPLRIMHWINAVAMFIMIGSGWKIYNDEVIFGWLHFPEDLTIGKWAQHGLQWHFFGMWILVLNGLAYLAYGLATGRFRRMLLPIWPERADLQTVSDALRFQLAHDDLTHYNAVQKLLYIGIICVGIMMVHLRPGHLEAGAVLRAGRRCSAASRTRGWSISSAWRRSSVSSSCMSRWRCWCRKRWSPWSPAGPTVGTTRAPRAGGVERRHDHALHPVDLPAQGRRRSERPRGEPAACRGHRPAQGAARRGQPRRADHADRLRRERERARCRACCARSRPGTTRCRASSSGPIISRRRFRKRRWSSRRASTPTTTSRTSSRSTARPGSSSSPA